MQDVVFFIASLVQLVGESVALVAKTTPLVVGVVAILVLLGVLVLGVLHLTESPAERYRRRLYDAALALRREEAREAAERFNRARRK